MFDSFSLLQGMRVNVSTLLVCWNKIQTPTQQNTRENCWVLMGKKWLLKQDHSLENTRVQLRLSTQQKNHHECSYVIQWNWHLISKCMQRRGNRGLSSAVGVTSVLTIPIPVCSMGFFEALDFCFCETLRLPFKQALAVIGYLYLYSNRVKKCEEEWKAIQLLSLWLWITTDCGSQQTGKFLKRWAYQTTWPASWEICVQIRKQQLELDMEQQTGSK